MRKILIFSLSYYPSLVGGAEIAIKEITDRIGPDEIAFHLICNRFDSALPKVEKIGNITVHRVGFGTFSYLAKILFVPLAALQALSLNRKEHFDGFWAMMVYMTFPIMIARALGEKRTFGAFHRVPYILSLQEGDPFEHVFERWHIRLFSPLLRYGIRHAAVVQAISSFLGGWAKEMGFAGSLEIIPNGVDVAHFSQSYSADILEKTRAELTNKEGNVVLIHTGRMVLKNGLPDIIQALVHLPANISFVQIGAGPDEEKLWKLASECGVADRVHFGGFSDHIDLPRYLQASDIFIRPSLSEGMGNSFIEAMAAGVPVIATQVGGIADFLYDPELNPDAEPTGRAVKPHDPKGIARAVMLYLEDVDMTKRIVENARKMVIEKYDWNRVVYDMRTRVFSHIRNRPHV